MDRGPVVADGSPLSLVATGDVILDEPDPLSFFGPSADLLRSAAVTVMHVEVPHTERGIQTVAGIPANAAPLAHLAALAEVGADVATLAGNHIFDQGPYGIQDTVDELRRLGIATCGAGADLEQARQPAIVERQGVRVGVLSYNCVGPRESWASSGKAGCAYVSILTHYESEQGIPGARPSITTFPDPTSLAVMQADVARLREAVNVVVVSFHKGTGHTPALVEDYERQVARAAIDAGADMVVGHHAHIMRGIEFHAGRAIFHGLGNFVTVTRALSVEGNDSPERQAWAERRRELYDFAPDISMPTYPFHPESRNGAVAHCLISSDGVVGPGLVPCWIDDGARPVPLQRDEKGESVLGYIEAITASAGFGTRFTWEQNRVALSPAGDEPAT